ncbi:aldehyde dehydrogenase family protein [Aliiglaciecola lipolytica]|uniref:Aldehyde dehydrogenase n=1 Tax=Aliiglaciecola lipolytica E3 TaxID=1127673 RepID=K6YJF9_9ALTE|nr:aldehyde dehydrogenase family protein [Aliiglaciecola lipolytica]GAC16748.1 aldehyde dehydrogenase [Aliiglaciecola lipolytica E3]
MNAADPTNHSEIANLVSGVRDTFASGYSKDYAWRVEQLKQLELMIKEKQDDLLSALHTDLGKCKTEAWISELGFVLSDINHTIKHLKKWMKPRKKSTPIGAQPGKSYVLPEPLGTVLIIGAWNYPFQLLIAPLVAAIAAGNCAVLKPSELSSHMSTLLAQLIPKYLDNNAYVVVEGAVDETTELLKQQFDHIFYTGGEAVGKIVMSAAAKHLTPVTLELGGKSPCIVDNSANIDVTAARIVWSKWMNAGQTCVAPDYVLVEKSISDQLVIAIQNKISDFYGKKPETSKDYGKIINERHFQRLTGYLENQNVVFGGNQNIQTGFFEPTLVLDPALDSTIMQEEIFGPILPIITLDSIDEAIPMVNARAKPLALYVYTDSNDYEQKVLQQTSAGNVCVNDGFMFMTNPDLPFGGVGNSGMGSYHGQSGFDRLSHLKTVMKRSFKFDVSLRYPPFSKFKLSILKRVL